MSWGDDGRGLCFVMTRGRTGTGLGFKKSEDSSSDVEGVSGMPSACEHGLEDKEEIERVGDETCPEIGMGGCGNLNDTSVKVSWNESGDCSGLEDSVGGRGAGRGEKRESSNGERSLSASMSVSRAILISAMFACRRLAFIPGLLLPLELAEGIGEEEREDIRDSSSSSMIFNGWQLVEDDRVNSGTLRARAVRPCRFNIVSCEKTVTIELSTLEYF